jgi:cell division protein ZapE
LPSAPEPLPEHEVRARAAATGGASLDDFAELCAHLATLHPSRYGALVDDVTTAYLTGTHTVTDESTALRLVVLADRLYDRQVPLLVSGVAPDRLFSAEMLAGGYRKKYRRAISRLVVLNRRGVGDG